MKRTEQLSDFEVLFKDSTEYFAVKNARLFKAGPDCFHFNVFKDGKCAEEVIYPAANIHRIKRYYRD